MPVSVTHAKRAPISESTNAQLPTEGPFARLERSKATHDDMGGSRVATGGLTTSTSAGQGDRNGNYNGIPKTGVDSDIPGLETRGLNFWYSNIDGKPLSNHPPVVQDMTISLPQGSTCLLVGPNGAGKTTLLKVLGGKHMVDRHAVSVLGEPPFHATHLVSDGSLSYIGGNWERDVAFAGYSIPLAVGY